MLAKNFIVVHNDLRIKLELSVLEYMVLYLIDGNTISIENPWYAGTYEELASMLGITRRHCIRITSSLCDKGYVTKNHLNCLQTSDLWRDTVKSYVSKFKKTGERLTLWNNSMVVIAEPLVDTKTAYQEIFDHWNVEGVIVHKKLSKDATRAINVRLKEGYSVDEINQSISNYAKVVKGTDFYFGYKWILADFLNRAFEKFKDWKTVEMNYGRDRENKKQFESENLNKYDKFKK